MSSDVAERTINIVLDLARQVSQTEVSENLDPLSAGFDSIAIMELAVRLEEELDVPCSIEDIFDTPSFAELARELATRIDEPGSR